ncbi:MAG: hypothetical protein H0W16_08135, partial [Actinobacteria bacterium]|nr:hypothetical protein [Actinomycetota bacterium]
EHLLLGLGATLGTAAGDCLAQLGAHPAALRHAIVDVVGRCVDRPDADALRELGIDFDEVRRRAEEAFGPGALERTRAGRRAFGARTGAIPFTPRAKEALELALKASVARHDGEIGSAHVLLGILDQKANAGLEVLERLDLSAETVRQTLLERLAQEAA